MENTLLEVIEKSQVADNATRQSSEAYFFELVDKSPGEVVFALLNLGNASALSDPVKQTSFVYVKRAVLRHWSIGFDQFAGNPISTADKGQIRQKLLESIVNCGSNSKLRKSVSNIIATISVVDYPDEWPDLMGSIYRLINFKDPNVTESSLIAGLTILIELFDDLITDDQFFDSALGPSTISYCLQLLDPSNSSILLPIKCLVVTLLELMVRQLYTPLNSQEQHRVAMNNELMPKIFQVILANLQASVKYLDEICETNVNIVNVEYIVFISQLEKSLEFMATNLRRRPYHTAELKQQFQQVVLDILERLAPYYYNFVVAHEEHKVEKFYVHNNAEYPDAVSVFENMLVTSFEVLTNYIDQEFAASGSAKQFVNILIVYNSVTLETYETCLSDFNQVVAIETEVTIDYNVRRGISDLISNSDTSALTNMIHLLCESFRKSDFNEWTKPESLVSLIGFVMASDVNERGLPKDFHVSLLNDLMPIVERRNSNPCLIASTILTIIKVAKANESIALPQVIVSLLPNIAFHVQNETEGYKLMIAMLLVGLSGVYLSDHELNLDEQSKIELQNQLTSCIELVSSDFDDDTSEILCEALTFTIGIHKKNAQKSAKFLKIIFDASIFGDESEWSYSLCLLSLFYKISQEDFITQCNFAVPLLQETINKEIGNSQENSISYSNKLVMSLEFWEILIRECPSDTIPNELFMILFPLLTHIATSVAEVDDQVTRLCGGIIKELISRSPQSYFSEYKYDENSNGFEALLKIIEKFLSPTVSDSAASELGSILLATLQKFGNVFDEYIETILKAAVKRLAMSKEILIITTLLQVFVYLFQNNTENALNFLANMEIEGKSGLELVLNVWFENFTSSATLYETLMENIEAMAKIYLCFDERLDKMMVKGDLIESATDPNIIITRSMAKKMPLKYTSVSANLKIVKVIIAELKFNEQAEAYAQGEEAVPTDGDDGEWEDLEDLGIPDMKTIMTYVQADDEETRKKDGGSKEKKAALVDMIKTFAKSNPQVFEKHFEQLTADEKKTLGETIGF